MKNILLFVGILFLIPSTSYTQQNSFEFTKKERASAVEAIGKVIEDNYVFPDVADKIGRSLRTKLKEGQYDKIKDPSEFAEVLTKDVQSFNGDKHLRVFFEPKPLGEQELSFSDEDRKKFEMKRLGMEKRDNFLFKEVKILDGNIGYMDLRGFRDPMHASETAISAVGFLRNTDAIILDLRNNGGGYPEMVQLIASYFFDGDPIHLNSFYNRIGNSTRQFWTLPHVPGEKLPDVHLYILTSSSTFSAAEEFAYDLKHLKRAIIVGEATGGGAHPGRSIYANDQFKVWTPTGRGINPVTKSNWEGVGVIPHIKTSKEDALLTAQIEALDSLRGVSEDMQRKTFYDWHIKTLIAKQQPVEVAIKILESYAGSYGKRSVLLEGKSLYYQRVGSEKVELIPLDDRTFQYGDLTDVRVKFINKENKVDALMMHSVYGRNDTYKKMDN